MKVIKKILLAILFVLLIPYQIINLFIKGFKTLSLFLSRGFYFYFEKFFALLKRIFNFELFDNMRLYFKRRQEDPSHIVLIIAWFLTLLYLFDTFYVDHSAFITKLPSIKEEIAVKDNKDNSNNNVLLSKELNLYRIYGKYGLKDINFDELKKSNVDTRAWIIVEGTNVNYPVVQSTTNDYYLTHSFDHSYTHNGWTFMDFRNDSLMNDRNTIFYGHNLLNGTAFGSLSNVFKTGSAAKIMVLTTDNKMYTYQVFSGYEIDAEIYYLQTDFFGDDDYEEFINTIANRNILPISNQVEVEDKIITLSTCTDDNSGRKVLHAKLINVEEV